jgi:PAS domain S-box-containing protein
MAPEHKDQRGDEKSALDSTKRVRNVPFESERGILMICGVLCALIFLLDVMLRIGFVASVLYVIPVLVCIWSPRRRTMFVVAIVSTVLTIAAVPLKPPGDELLPLFNRPVSLVALWTAAFLVDLFITEHNRSEEALKEEKDRLSSLINSINDEVWFADAQGRFTLTNPSALHQFGLDPTTDAIDVEDLASSLDVFRPDGSKRPQEEAPPVRALRGEVIIDEEEMVITPATGELRYRQVNSAPVRDSKGNILGSVSVVHDITEQKRNEQNLARSNADLQQFAYGASHDLQEPLRMVVNFLSLLEKKYKDELDPNAQEYIRYAVEGGARMHRLIDDLLLYSRVDTKVSDLKMIDMNVTVAKALTILEGAIHENNVEVIVGPLPSVFADESQMVLVWQNLVSNAVKFHGPERPTIHISAEEGAMDWTFAVKDNGIGLNMEYSDKIFQMFQRLQTREVYPGTGIGLTIAKKIVDRRGGRIWVESEEGKGATFFFTIPKSKGSGWL